MRLKNLLPFFALVLLGLSRLLAQTPAAAPDCLLQPFDLLRLQVYQEPELTIEVRVTQQFTVTLPLIDKVDLRNKTLRQAEQMIRELYNADYLVNPQVNLIVVEYAKRTINVLGSVNTPGAVLFPPDQKLSLVDAIARAGGMSRLADGKRVRLTRTGPEGKTESTTIDVKQILDGSSTEPWPLQVNDTIYVPERIL